MKDTESELLVQKIFNTLTGGIALCELMLSKSGNPVDWSFIMVNDVFENQLDRKVGSIVGRTIKEIYPEIEQSRINKLASVVLKKIPTKFIDYNQRTKKYFLVNAFSQAENKFVITIDDITSQKSSEKKLTFLNNEKKNRKAELVIANIELVFQNNEKEKRAAELATANKELAFQNDEKKKRAAELVAANEELHFQNSEKEKRALELTDANIELAFLNTEKDKQALELTIAKEKRKKSDLLNSAFLNNLTYEIRTPMKGILGFSELLKNPNITAETQQDYIRIIEKFGSEILIELEFMRSSSKPNFLVFEEVIQENLYKNLTVSEFAILSHMSLTSFKRKFNEVYDQSPIKYLSKMKLQKAFQLLKDKNKKISHIAYDVGFQSLSTFNRAFKAHYGRSPSECRTGYTD